MISIALVQNADTSVTQLFDAVDFTFLIADSCLADGWSARAWTKRRETHWEDWTTAPAAELTPEEASAFGPLTRRVMIAMTEVIR